MNTRQLTYEVNWRCTHCQVSGTAAVSTNDACDKLFEDVVVEHAVRSPACAESKKTSGLALEPGRNGGLR